MLPLIRVLLQWLVGGSLAVLSALATAGWMIGLLLVLVLAVKEMIRAYGGPGTRHWLGLLTVATIPLVVAFALILVVRLVPVITGP